MSRAPDRPAAPMLYSVRSMLRAAQSPLPSLSAASLSIAVLAGAAPSGALRASAAEAGSPKASAALQGGGGATGADAATRAADERMARAIGLAREGNHAAAERALLEADRERRDYAPVLERLVDVELSLGKTQEALEALERLLRKGEPFDDRAYLLAAQTLSDLGMQVAGEKLMIEWAGSRRITPNFRVAIGVLRMGAFEFGSAEIELRKALEADPASGPALKAMFQIYGRFDKYEALQPLLDKALAARPSSVEVLMLAGGCLLRQQNYEAAKIHFEQITKIEPANPAGWVNLGSAVTALGDERTGFGHYRKAIELDPKGFEAPMNLALALKRAGRNTESREVLLEARRRGARDLGLLNALVMAHYLSGDLDAAAGAAKESLTRDPKQATVRQLLDRIETEKGAKPAAGAAGSAKSR